MSRPITARSHQPAFTLIELLIVVAIIAILAAIAVVNMREATERSVRAANAANLKTLAVGLQSYFVDFGKLPPADGEAGPASSPNATTVGNGPAAGGSWDGVPWLLYELKYVSAPETLFCTKYKRLYPAGTTIRGGHPRYHNFRYAYNSAAVTRGGHLGGSGLENGNVWLVRDLYVSPLNGFYAARYPHAPADYHYPWGPDHDQEHALYADGSVRLVYGGTDEPAK